MSALVFVDTNVLVYARDTTHPAKQQSAARWMAALWSSRQGRVSFQVLQEFYVTVTSKLSPGMERGRARAEIRALMTWKPIRTDATVLENAWRLQDSYGFSWWDALIVSAAQAGRCGYLLTEDLQPDSRIDGLRVVNPFQEHPESMFGAD